MAVKKTQEQDMPSIVIKTLKPVTLDFSRSGVPQVRVPIGETVTVSRVLAKELVSIGSAEYVGEPPVEA